MKTKSILVPIYNQKLVVIYSSFNDFKELVKEKHRYDVKISLFTEAYTLELVGGGARALYLFFNKSHVGINQVEKFIRLMSHEMVHILDYILQFAGVKSDPENNEARAYLSGYLARLIYSETTAMMQPEQ